MTVNTYHNLHPNFKLNDIGYSKENLCSQANNLIHNTNEFEQDLGHFILNWFDENSFVKIQTSGTTGTPKIITVEKQAMVNSALATGLFFNLTSGNTALNCLPIKYIAGKMMLVRAFVLGLEIDAVEPNSNPLKNNHKEYDFVAMVPLQVENSLSQLHQIKTLIIGGVKMNPALEEKLINNPCQSFETYSMTETVTHIAAKRVGEKAFTILPNVTIKQDERQCLVISAPNLNPDDIVTNDVVELISERQFIWLGRMDNVINSGGIKFFPEQIESKLAKKINRKFFVGGISDEKFGEKLILVIEGDFYDLEDSLFEDLDKYEKPKEIRFIDCFPETETGKIKRKEILKSL